MNKKSVYYAVAALTVAVCMSVVGCSSDKVSGDGSL
jgi:hypothetical protein